MAAGENMKQRAVQYAVRLEDNVWRILDSYHPGLSNLDETDVIDDSHEAVTVLPMAAMVEVVRKAESEDILEHMFGGVSEEELNEVQLELEKAETEIGVLKDQLEAERNRPQPTLDSSPVVVKAELSEDAQIVSDAINSITQLASQAQIGKVAGNGRSNS
jgi:hypothetical protein